MVKKKYLINEVAKEVHVESHVLRYWEEELELPIQRNDQGHRVYTEEDIHRFIKIKELKDNGFQLKAVRNFLDNMSKANITKKEKHELAIQIKDMNEIQDPQKEQTERLQYLFQKLIKEAVAENNEAMTETLVERITENVKSDLCKELDYQFRVIEEREEQRIASKQEMDKQRDEEYYKRLDELLRRYNSKGLKAAKEDKKEKKIKEKADSKEKVENKEKKQKIFFWKKENEEIKRDFKLVGKAAEVK